MSTWQNAFKAHPNLNPPLFPAIPACLYPLSWAHILWPWARPSTCQVFICPLFSPSTYPSTSSSNFYLVWDPFLTHQGRCGYTLLPCVQTTLFCIYVCVCTHVTLCSKTHYARLLVAPREWLHTPGLDNEEQGKAFSKYLREWNERKEAREGGREKGKKEIIENKPEAIILY